MYNFRPYTKRLTDIYEDGTIDRELLFFSLLNWLGEQQVKDFYKTIEQEIENERQSS